MRFDDVEAHAFGSLSGARLDLAPGMNVVFGPNEAGKSTWHAALYASLCGMRRVRGASRTEDREFADRHRPWEGTDWDVSARIELADGRRIEIRQDLDGKVDCRAVDLGMGSRDVSGDIINEGSPDGSRWLGLDRRAFLATACVQQAQLRLVRDDARELQEHLQRAAATAGRDETAAAAITAIDDFQREHVGLDRANSNRPLRSRKERKQSAEATLRSAREQHAGYLDLVAQAEAEAADCESLARELQAVRALEARRSTEKLRRRRERLDELARRFAAGPPPARALHDELALKVAVAIRAWEERPDPPVLGGPTAAALEGDLAALPSVPPGDREPHLTVLSAHEELSAAERMLALHERDRPAEPCPPECGGASEDTLRELAHELEQIEPALDPGLDARVEAARSRLEEKRRPSGRSLAVVVGLVSLAMAGIGVILGHVTAGLLVLVAGLAIALLLLIRRDAPAEERSLAELREAEALRGVREHHRLSIRARVEGGRRRAESLGLVADPAGLRGLAQQLGATNRQAAEARRWLERRDELADRAEQARQRLGAALAARGVETTSDLAANLSRYRAECATLYQLSIQAARAGDLEREIASRQAAEHAAAEAQAALQRTRDALQEAAQRCGVAASDDEARADGLRAWLADRGVKIAEREAARNDYAELGALLEGRDPGELARQWADEITRLENVAHFVPEKQLYAIEAVVDAGARAARLEEQVKRKAVAAGQLEGAARDRARRIPSVPEAEEDLAEAARELERVERLDAVLKHTRRFLVEAQERVHRDVAAVLRDTIVGWLPRATSGRYTDASIDPESLTVKVKDPDGHWREAALLSHGTAEQIYLLLRIGLAQHLTAPGEVCPMLLDEVTVQSDRDRTRAILELLHALSAERQVVLFTQEEDVLEWSETSLSGARDKLIKLCAPDAGELVA